MELVNGISDLGWQIVTGHCPTLNETMWYQISLIILTVIFILIFYFLPSRWGVVYVIILAVVSLAMQYTGANYNMFASLRYELMYPLGRTVEMIPAVTAGFLLAYFDVYKRGDKFKIWAMCLSAVLLLIVLMKPVFPGAPGYGYSGINGTFVAVCIMTVFIYLAPIDKLPKSDAISKVTSVMTKYTLGIYCMHRLVAKYICIIYEKNGIETQTFSMCCVVYVVCYFVAFVMARIPTKLSRQLVE